MNKKMFKRIISIFAAALMLTSSFAVFADSGIITPWEYVNGFESSYIGADGTYEWNPTGSDDWNKKSGLYSKLIVRNNCPTAIRDSYIDETTGEPVYDGVTKTAGDKYLWFSNVWNTTDANGDPKTVTTADKVPGGVTFCASNLGYHGGLIYGKVHFSLDMRISDVTAADWSSNSWIKLYAVDTYQNQVEAVSFPIKHSASGLSWYTSAVVNGASSSPSVNTCEWIHIDFYVDVARGKYIVKAKPVDPDSKPNANVAGSFVSDEMDIKAEAIGLPFTPTIALQGSPNATSSVDNLTVEKEAFVIDEEATSIDVEAGNVNASISIGNTVYRNKYQVCEPAPTTSPTAILALYNKETGALIDIDFDTTTYDAAIHDVYSYNTTPDYQTVSLSLEAPDVEYEAKVYVWDSIGGMIPYTVTYPAAE